MAIHHFYLSVPNADGVFIGSKASDCFEDGISFYEFECFKDDPSNASFWLAKDAIELALENIVKRIESVCNSENHPDKDTRYIETIKPGVARLLPSGNWKMETKAKIKYLEANEQERQKKLRENEELKKQKEEETKVREAEIKLKEAEAKIKEAEAKAIEAEAKLKESEAKAKDEAAKKTIEEAIKKTRVEADIKIAEEKRKAKEAVEAQKKAEEAQKKAEADARELKQKTKQSSEGGCGKKIGCALIIFIILGIILALIEKPDIFKFNESYSTPKSNSEPNSNLQERFTQSVPSKPELKPLEAINITNSDMYYIPMRSGKNSYYQYITLDGKNITEAKYIRAYVFREGRALVQEKDNTWGYIDTKGNSIAGGYKQALSFRDGIAWVNDNGTIKAINLNGSTATSLPKEIISVWSFYEELALFSYNGMQNYLDKNLNTVFSTGFADGNRFQENMASVMCDNGKYRYIDKNMTDITNCVFDDAKVFKNDRAIVRISNSWGIINKQGDYVLRPNDDITEIIRDEDMFRYQKKNGKRWGWLDSDGRIVIQPDFQSAMNFGDRDITPASQNSLWGYIDKNGKYVVDLQYKFAYPFINNRAFVKIADNYYVTIDKNGNKDLQTKYQEIDNSYLQVINYEFATESRIMTVEPSSFNCIQKFSDEEKTAMKMICNSFNLIDLDNKMHELYEDKKSYPYIGEELVESSKTFLEERNNCRDIYCLEKVYEARIEELRGM